MAYQTQNIANLSAILGHVDTFAAAQGWTVTGGNTYTHPSLGGALSASLSVVSNELIFTPSGGGGAPVAKIASPILNSGVQLPTKLHMFIAQTPEPYIALCVEFGFNLYRHLYFGYMQKVGSYTGGEVLGASNHQSQSNVALSENHYDIEHQYLFRGHHKRWANGFGGGVRAGHANNTNTWRKFDEDTSLLNDATDFADTTVFGGYGDAFNDGLVAHGTSPFLASNILTPINLYAPRFPGSNPHMVPLGSPAGVRLVNMKDLEPGSQITVGMVNWRVFAAHSKQSFDEATYGAGTYPLLESSGHVGYAYPET